MKLFTIEDIRSWDPCYDPIKYLPEGWSGTAVDILRHAEIPAEDKLWVVCRESLIDDKTLRLFAVWCCRQVQHLTTDPRSVAAVDCAEKFAHGEATKDELAAARAAARDAAWDAAGDAAGDAAEAAAWDAVWDAAGDAAEAAAWDAAEAAAWAAVWDAARAAAWDAAGAAARAAARDAAGDAQVAQLIKMLEEK